jgi:hypothetical protein
MNPADANSSLATLRQLKEMLDAGTLTPQEFEALKQKLVFGKEPTSLAAETPAPEASPATPAAVPEAAPAPPVPLPLRVELPAALDATDSADWMAVSAPIMLENTFANEAAEEIETPEERRSSLTIVFIVGGALLLLAIVLYLTIGTKTPDEHLTSTSQTAADSTATVPETGPQANQITLPPAAPETVRVAPAVPVAPIAPAAAKFRTDSVVTPAAVAAPAPVKAIPKPAPTTTVATDTAI